MSFQNKLVNLQTVIRNDKKDSKTLNLPGLTIESFVSHSAVPVQVSYKGVSYKKVCRPRGHGSGHCLLLLEHSFVSVVYRVLDHSK